MCSFTAFLASKFITESLYKPYRHSGVREIFKRKGIITKLQKAMDHSFINVSLTVWK